MRLARTALALATTVASVTLLAPPAAEATSTLQYWYGTVSRVPDGDTVYVDIRGDGKPPVPVRNLGIQATEMHDGPRNGPECHAREAAARLNKLLPRGTKVRLAAFHARSTAGVDPYGIPRLQRYVDKYNPATKRYDIDVQLDLLSRGLVMWGSDAVENARAAKYHAPMQKAMHARVGLFDVDHCGAGPGPAAPLPMWIHYDANGNESAPNSEWVRIRNRSETPLSIAGWKLRDHGHTLFRGRTYYTFPAGAKIPARGFVTVYPGSGTTSVKSGKYYLGSVPTRYFPNLTDPALGYPGKAIYLLDPQLDFRGWADYSCQVSCPRPKVQISAVQYKTSDEYVELRVAPGVTTPVDLTGVVVSNDGWTKELRPNTVLRPGETLRVYCERTGADRRLQQHWGHTGSTMLEDAGDTVVLRTARAVTLSTYRWGRG